VELTNAERERAVESLKAAVRAGAISLDEFEERLQGVYAANSQDELEMLLTLHGLQLAVPRVSPRSARLRWFTALVLMVVAIGAVLGVGLAALHSRALRLAKTSAAAPSSQSASTVPSPAATSLAITIVPAGVFARHDGANKCGPFAAPVSMGSGTVIEDFDNCYLVVRFTNIGSSYVDFIPAQLRMVDYDGNTYTTQTVAPRCYDSTDINAPTTLKPHRSLTLQLCYPVSTGALPAKFTGFFTLAGVNAPVSPSAVLGTWGGR